jgi:hypothetical protein
MSEIELHRTSLSDQMSFAQAVVTQPERGQSLLPREYQGNPANVLIAVGLGQSMGLSPAESLYRITVIQGKPTASAELIAANVRKAGHKLRMKVSENPPSATCTIIRADDPDEPTTITRDMKWAADMGLATKDNYKKQPSTMLSWRAISACARLACPEALYGVAHTPDEIEPDDRPARTTPAGGLGAALAGQTVTVEQVEFCDKPSPHPAHGACEGVPEPEGPMAQPTRGRMFALFAERGITDRDEQIRGIVHIIGRPIESRAEITEAEGHAIIAKLEQPTEPTS